MSRASSALGCAVAAATFVFGGGFAYAPASTGPVRIAQWRDSVSGVAQDDDSIVWCDWRQLSIRELARPSTRRVALPDVTSCGMGAEMAVVGRDVAWHGYDDLRTTHTDWTLAALTSGQVHRIAAARQQFAPGAGNDILGLVSDGRSFFYAQLRSFENVSTTARGAETHRQSERTYAHLAVATTDVPNWKAKDIRGCLADDEERCSCDSAHGLTPIRSNTTTLGSRRLRATVQRRHR